jgi:phosphatidylethanolamine-binding protein (PEBP) family uncharacterized protein
MTDAERISEWLHRVADDIKKLRADYASNHITTEELLNRILQSYDTLSVMKMVATGQAYMRGITPPKEM